MKTKTSEEIRDLYIKFFESKGHKESTNASLVPLNDPSVLFTTAGMHPLVPYLLGQPHPQGTRLVNVQRCVRTNDIEEVGDTTHLTFFEMLGYWSLGDYFKDEALEMTFEFFTNDKYMGFDPKRLYVTVFEGDEDAPMDETSVKKWTELFKNAGIEAKVWNKKDFKNNPRIFPLNKKENWWGPAGQTGPCGPDSELFYWRGVEEPDFDKYVPWDDSGMFIEISNDVFMEFNKTQEGEFESLTKKNVDFGSGLERVTMISQNKDEDGSFPMTVSIYDTDLFQPIIEKIEEISGVKYDPSNSKESKFIRVVAEHARSSTFILADGVFPGNKDQGYVLRRLIRILVRNGLKLGIETNFTKELAIAVIEKMSKAYPHLKENEAFILDEVEKEEIKFRRTLDKGLKEVQKMKDEGKKIDGNTAFYIYETYGFPLEMTLDEFGIENDEMIEKIQKDFEEQQEKHRDESRAGAEQKFKGGLADQSEETTKLHTAHHLLLKALQTVLGEEVKQRGSNITGERLRIDFNYHEKLNDEQVAKVEEIVNKAIDDQLPVRRIELPKDVAENIGAQMEFGQKYPDTVSVYFIGGTETGDEKNPIDGWFSAEFCGGPHVENTSEIGAGNKKFKIAKQESIGAGLRRIKAQLV